MAVPKRRTSKRMRGHRRSHDALTLPTLISCSNCSTLIRPHRVCPHCGHFKGKEVLQVEAF